tara:strand:+ start:4717 stop:4947 length:231 start_codon:yes stop_codon:yes gene_type:complete
VNYFVSVIISLDYSYHYFSKEEPNLYLKEYAPADVYYAYLGEVASLDNNGSLYIDYTLVLTMSLILKENLDYHYIK